MLVFHHDSAALLTGVSETNHSLCGEPKFEISIVAFIETINLTNLYF